LEERRVVIYEGNDHSVTEAGGKDLLADQNMKHLY
jgi:hypothetical protein